MEPELNTSQPLTSRIVEVFLHGNLSAMLVVLSLIAGAVALLVTPREEEPQIIVPMADVHISVPGASAEEVERQVALRLEKMLYQIDGVEYVYSMSRPHQAVVTVRFYVGEDREDSLIKIYNKLQSNTDAIPPQVAGWVVKPIEIDDVPIVDITLWSDRHDDFALRRVAEELESRIQSVPNTGPDTYRGRPVATGSHRVRCSIAGRSAGELRAVGQRPAGYEHDAARGQSRGEQQVTAGRSGQTPLPMPMRFAGWS